MLCLPPSPLRARFRLGTALVIGGLVARGRYRRSVDRAPAVAKAPALQGGASRAAPVLLPLVTVPVTSALDAREATQLLLAPDASATDGGMEGGEAKGLLHPAAPTPVNVLPGRP